MKCCLALAEPAGIPETCIGTAKALVIGKVLSGILTGKPVATNVVVCTEETVFVKDNC